MRRSLPRAWMLSLSAALCVASGAADPLPVHTPTAQVTARPTAAQRLALADAVAAVLSAALPEVLSAAESHTRVETLAPGALACAEAACAASIRTALGARGVVIVRVEPGVRRRLRVTIDVIDRRGESVARNEGEETVGGWDDALALARVVAGPLVARVREAEAAPTPTPTPAPSLTQHTETTAVGPREGVLVAAGAGQGASASEPPLVAPEGQRRPAEAVLGGALLVGGLVAAALGSVSIARDGSPAPGMAIENADRVYVAGTRDYVLLGAGAAGAVLGAVLLIDGVRTHRAAPGRVRPVAMWAPGLVGAGVSGGF